MGRRPGGALGRSSGPGRWNVKLTTSEFELVNIYRTLDAADRDTLLQQAIGMFRAQSG